NAEDLFINETYFVQPLGDTSIGERGIDAQTWSSTEYLSLTMRGDVTVFGVNFIDGRIKGYPRYQPPTGVVPRSMYFRMVRGNTSYGLNNFVDNGDGTVTDLATGLMWQQADDGNTRDWEDALEYAEGSSRGGFGDWRLPNSKELQSIVDYTRSPDVTHSAAIDPIFSATSFSDPDGNPGQYGHYWTGSPLLDGPNPYLSAGYVAFGEAQGRLNGNLMDAHGAGAARSDPKTGDPADYPQYHGPQGDVQYVFNYVRIVRDANVVTSSESGLDQLPDKIQLDQNYPNPFNPQTLISFSLPESGEISLKVFDLLGRVVASLASGTYTAGSHSVSWRANDRPGGRYFYSLETASAIETKSMILIK
ncbi:MAG: DUF1566 domain-containing protein, partial [Bacteroidetes Order II. Incertae sedis bacterium]|nr:DUF1566 domain-containing protein [Bacteroidetes Order II. bacterium]